MTSPNPFGPIPGVKKKQPELALHIQVADFLRLAMPSEVAWTTVAHGGFELPKRTAEKLKAMGLQAGWCDVQLIHPVTGIYHGIELKSDKGQLSHEQRHVHQIITKSPAQIAVCRSLDEVIGTLRGWSFPMRARAA